MYPSTKTERDAATKVGDETKGMEDNGFIFHLPPSATPDDEAKLDEDSKLNDLVDDYEAKLDELINDLNTEKIQALEEADRGVVSPESKLAEELAMVDDLLPLASAKTRVNPAVKFYTDEVQDHSSNLRPLPESRHHSLPVVEGLWDWESPRGSSSAMCTPVGLRARWMCSRVSALVKSNVQLIVIFGMSALSLSLLIALLGGSSPRQRSIFMNPQQIKSAVGGHLEKEREQHPDILGDTYEHVDALRKTVQAGKMIRNISSAVAVYVLWVINYELFEFSPSSDGTDGGIWSADYRIDDMCLWHGVQCDHRGDVAVIDLEGMEVAGDLPVELYLLRDSLTAFSLRDNINMGRNGLPAFLYQMTKLSYVNICGTSHRGPDGGVTAFCRSGAGRTIVADFECDCCVPCDNDGSSRTSN